MNLSELTENQRELIITLIEELASGEYSSEFVTFPLPYPEPTPEWMIVLTGIGGGGAKEIGTFEGHGLSFTEADLLTLKKEGFLTLTLFKEKFNEFKGSLTRKAYEQYKSHMRNVPREGKLLVLENNVAPALVSETQLEQIAATSEGLLRELQQNYSLSRSQATTWFRWSLGVSVFGFLLLAVGVGLVFAQQTTPAITNSIAGIIAEFVALLFFRQANSSNQRQDQYHRDLLRRQQILDAVQLARLISDERDRDKITESIIKQLLGITS